MRKLVTTRRLEEEIEIDDKPHVVREADAAAAEQFRNASLGVHVFTEDGKTHRLNGAGSLQPLLVHLCLWKKHDNGKEGRYTLDQVRAMPDALIKELYKVAQDVSPSLREHGATVEQLDKQINELQELRAKIAADKQTEELKN